MRSVYKPEGSFCVFLIIEDTNNRSSRGSDTLQPEAALLSARRAHRLGVSYEVLSV